MFKITLTLFRARYSALKNFRVGEATVIFQDPKNVLASIILIPTDREPIFNCLRKGNTQSFSLY